MQMNYQKTDLYFISQIKAPPPLSVCSKYQFLVINMKCPKQRELILEIRIGESGKIGERERERVREGEVGE